MFAVKNQDTESITVIQKEKCGSSQMSRKLRLVVDHACSRFVELLMENHYTYSRISSLILTTIVVFFFLCFKCFSIFAVWRYVYGEEGRELIPLNEMCHVTLLRR